MIHYFKSKYMQLFLIIFLLFIFSAPAQMADDISREDQIKAVFIYNFTKYIQWPESDTSEVFIIGVLGNSNLVIPLRRIAQKRLVNNKKIQVIQFYNIEDVKNYHILFLSPGIEEHFQVILQKIRSKNILTIGNENNFTHLGGIINLIRVEGKIKFEMNLKALSRAGLAASSQLLKLAILVEENE